LGSAARLRALSELRKKPGRNGKNLQGRGKGKKGGNLDETDLVTKETGERRAANLANETEIQEQEEK